MGAYEAGLDAGGHDAGTKARLLAQSALWRNVYIAESSAQAENELAALLLRTRAHMMHVRAAYNPADFTIDRAMLNPWADPAVGDDDAVKYVLATGRSMARHSTRRRGPAAASDHPLCSPACIGCGPSSSQR